MKIVILGAGRVGASVAESLVSEQNDITVVDTDPARLAELQDRLDLRTVTGNAAQPSVLRNAGADDADMLIATTQSDETNLVACHLAAQVFNVPTRIARVRGADFQDNPELVGEGAFSVDHLIVPEKTVTDYVAKLVEFPEALQVLEFANGAVSLIAVRANRDGLLVSKPIREIKKHIPNVDSRIVAIFRGESTIYPDGDTMIEPGDEVFFLAATEHIRTVLTELRKMDRPVRRVMLAGGGRIGMRLAKRLAERRIDVRIIEPVSSRCSMLAAELPSNVLVLNGDATDEDLLEEESVGEMDLFCALTSDDEDNIMSSLLAKKMGAKRVIALINRRAYADLVEGGKIDIAIVPAQATIGELLAHVRRGDVAAVHSLRRGAAEALEAVAHGDPKSSKVVGRRIEQVDLPAGATIGAIVRQAPGNRSEVIIAHHDTTIEPEDHVIVFVTNKRLIPRVEKLFQVGVGFF
ncbi:MAG: Trk system potassium transporter TrkA [Burkholderiaceae bacterium]|jgi:trk system potassium uptake protein TrkA|nr:Trk system potassium transporter TrkA [Burkholderiales bacterium]MCZ8104426.1 Trk system potassium transporter TrkA [Burkholderiales bacterium]MCZ8340500.1 Trk system potassium transporter TrkA [Burkholderiaceae bacterium]